MNSDRINNRFEKSLVILALVFTGMTTAYFGVFHLRWMFQRSTQTTPKVHKISTQSTLNNFTPTPISRTRDNI